MDAIHVGQRRDLKLQFQRLHGLLASAHKVHYSGPCHRAVKNQSPYMEEQIATFPYRPSIVVGERLRTTATQGYRIFTRVPAS